MGKVLSNLKERWKANTPKFFKKIIWIGTGISGLAIAIHTALVMAGAFEPQWWVITYPYVIGVPAGMSFISKFTRDYGIEEQKK